MPQQYNRLGYPCTTSIRDKKGKLQHQHRTAWLNVIITKKGTGARRMYLKQNIPGVGEVITWINITVADTMIQFLLDKTGKRFTRLSKKQRYILFGESTKERVKKNVPKMH